MNSPILAPAAVLILWSLIMLLWMAGTRLPAMSRIGMDLSKAAPGGRGVDIDPNVPPTVAWKSHNYAHLMVVLRILHSLWQALVNTIPLRFGLFLLSSICLIALAISAVRVTLAA